LDSGKVNSYSEAGKLYGLSRARICQILRLLKLPEPIQDFLLELKDPVLVRKFGEHKFRNLNRLNASELQRIEQDKLRKRLAEYMRNDV